jgi:hypothetical protein
VPGRRGRQRNHGGFGITGTPGNLRFTRPDGRVIEAEPLGPGGQSLDRSNARAGVMVDPATIVSGWCGDRLNRGYVVSCIVGSKEWQAGRVRIAAEAAAARDGPDG